MPEYSLKKKILFSLLPALVAFFLALLLGELYARLFSQYGYVTPEILKNRSLQYEPSIFSRYVFPRKELNPSGYNNLKYHINGKGYRGHDFEVSKPAGTIRMMFYGGSAVFDQAVGGDNDWPHRVERILRGNGFPNLEVINAGVPGSDTFDSFGRFFSEGHLFQPDYVVLYNAWNDFEYFTKKDPILRQFQPYLAGMDPRVNYQNRPDKFFCEHSQLYVRLRSRYYNWKFRIGPEGSQPQGELSEQITDQALRQYQINVEMFVELAKNIGATPILMIQARLVSPDNTEAEKKRIKYQYALLTHQGLVKAFSATDQILREVAQNQGAFLIDANQELGAKSDLFIDHIHLNDLGSRALAELAAAELEKILKEKSRGQEPEEK